jgi:hypothetical protein
MAVTDHLTGRRLSLVLDADGNPLPPAKQRAQIQRALELIQAEVWFFAQRSPDCKRHRQVLPPPLGRILANISPRAPARAMFRCVAAACQKIVAAPAFMRLTLITPWVWGGCVMDRVTRGRVSRVQVRLQRRSQCFALRCRAPLAASARAFSVCDAFNSKRWMIFGSARRMASPS